MDVQMPDGTIVTGVPDNITQTELLARFNKYNTPDTPVTMKEAALGGVKRMLGSSETAVSGLFGAEEAAKEGLARQEGITERSGASLDKVKAAYEKGLWPAVKEVASQIPTAIAEQSPQLAATIGSARLGAMAGSPFGPWGAGAGALLGAAIPSYFQQAGSNLERQAQEGKPVSGAAAYSAAVPQAALDVFTNKILFSRLMGVPVKALGTAEAEALAKQSLLTTLRKGTVKGIAAEVPPEVTQQMLERLQAGLPLTDDAARKEYLDTAYQVALLGPLGAIGSVQERGEAKDVVAQQQQQAQEEAARAQRQATGVMEQQPLFDANQAPIPPIAEPTLTPPEAPISTIAPEEAPVEQPVPAGQGDLFTRRGTPTKDALASVEAARVQGIPAQVEQLKTTPEGRAELIANMKAYYPDLSVKERNVERLNLQRMNVVPVVAPEGTLTPEILKSVGIVPNNRTATPIYNALVGTHITNPTTYNLLATLADTPSKSDIGIKANTLLDKFQHFNPNAVQSDLFPGERNAPEAQIQTAEPVQATQATEPVQADLFGVSEDGVRDNTEQQRVEPSLDVPVSPAPTEIKETPKSKRGRVDVPVAIPEPDNGAVAVGTAVQPSALAPIPKNTAKKAAQALKKEPVAVAWSYMSDTPYAKLSKISKDKVKNAHDDNYLTQELADEIDYIESGNARAEAANAAVKPETPLDETPIPPTAMVAPNKTTAFINDFFANTTQHAFSNKTRIVNNQAAVEISPQEGQIHIHDIQSFAPASFGEQGTGGGRKALRLLTDLADKHGVELNLTSQAYSEKGLSDDQLHSWYARNGFKDDEYGGMVRKPKTNINPAAAIRDKSSYQEYLESKRADLQALIDELSPPISKEAALHELKVAIAKWKKRAESGAEGRYGEGEIDQTIESFNQDPLAYAEIIPLSKKVVAALNKYDRTIEHALDELSNIDTEIEIAKSIHRQIVNGDYQVAINNLVKLGELDEKYKPFYTAIHTGNTRHALTFIEKNLHNKGDKILAKLLNQSNTLPIVRFAYTGSDSAIGTYEAAYDRVDIDAGYYLQDNINVSSMAKTLLHEVMHSATVNKLSKAMYITKMGTIGFATVNKKVRTPGWKEYQFTVNAPDGSVVTDFSKNEESFAKLVNERYGAPIMIDKEVREYLASDEYATANNIIEVFDWLSANHPKVFHPAMHYGATNPLEMMAEIFVNPTFYKAMTDITLPAHLVSKHPVKALHWFIRAIKRLIGLDAAPDSAIVTIMSDTLALTDRRVLGKHVLESTRTEEIGRRIHYDKYKGSNVTAQIKAQQEPTSAVADLEEAKRIERSVEGKSQVEVAQWIAENAPDKSYRLIAEKVAAQLGRLKAAGVNQTFTITHLGDTAPRALSNIGTTGVCQYKFGADASTNIYIRGTDLGNSKNEGIGTSFKTLLHELIHSATISAIHFGNFKASQNTKFSEDTQRLYKVGHEIIAHFNDRFARAKKGEITLTEFEKNHGNAFASVDELVTWGLTDEDMQNYLEAIPYKGTQSLWSEFVTTIRSLLGIPATANTALSEILSVSENILNADVNALKGVVTGAGYAMHVSPQAQALAQQTITNMAGPSLHANTALPRSTPTQIAQQIATTMTTNPTGAFGMIEDIVNKVRTKAIDKAATLAATIQDQNDGAFRDVNGQMRADLLLSAANNMRNYVTSFYAEGGIEVGASGEIHTVPSQHRMDGVYLAAQPLYARLGNTMAGKLVNDAFFYYRAKAFKALPQADWPENWIKDPSLVPTDTQINTALNAFNQFPELEAMRQQFIGTKNNLVKFLRQVGFLSAEKERAFLADDSYAPWIRIKDYTDKASGLGNIGRMVDLRQLKAVVGGSEEVNDMLENMAQFLAWGVRSGIANHSANAALKTMKTMNIATQYPGRPSNVDSSHTVMTYENGKPTFWQVDNPWHLAAFQTVKGMNSIMLGHIGRALGTLRAGIVLFPAFPVRQIVMDSQRAFMEAGVEHPWRMMGKIWGGIADAYKGTHADVVNLRRHGVTSEVDFNIHDTPHGRAADFGLGEHGKTITDRWVHSPAYKFLHALAYTADMAVRLGIYRQTMEETGDVALATTRSREIINFQKSGTSELLHTLKGTIPFLGAFLQGTDVNYRSMVGRGNSMKARKAAAAAYWTNMAMYSGLVIAYTMMMSGDDDYEEQKGFITDRNFLIPGGWLLPVPPDVGFLAKVVPERITDYILQNGTDNPESAARLRQGLLQAMATGFLPPAAVYGVTPAVELMLNKSFFSDLPIVGQRYQGLQADQQYTPSTSELAKTVGSITGQSPLQIDYIINAIGGTSAGAILQLADVIGGSSKMASDKLPLVGSFQQKTVGGRYAEEYYAVRELVDKAYNTAVAIQMEGDQAKLEAYLAQPKIQERLQAHTGIESIHAALNEVSHQRNMIANDPSLSPQEKRDATNTLMAQVEAGLKDMGIRKLRSEIE